MGKARILVVDDDREVRLALKLRLSAVGYEIIEAGTGEEALNQAITQRPSLILLDLNMPQGDGFAVLKALDANIKLSEIPVIIISARDDDETKSNVKEAGAIALLEKPLAHQDLIGTIHRALRNPPRWPGRMLHQVVFTFTRDDLVYSDMLTLSHGSLSPQMLIRNLSVLYFIGGVAMLMLQESMTGFLWCVLLGNLFLLCPTLVLKGFSICRIAWRLRAEPELLRSPFRLRFFLDTGLTIDYQGTSTVLPWHDLEGYVMGPHTILLFAKDRTIAIPRRALGDEEDEGDFLSIIRENSVPYARREAGNMLLWDRSGKIS